MLPKINLRGEKKEVTSSARGQKSGNRGNTNYMSCSKETGIGLGRSNRTRNREESDTEREPTKMSSWIVKVLCRTRSCMISRNSQK